MANNTLISFEPATGDELWSAPHTDVAAAVSRARKAWPSWAATAIGTRIEITRRFANAVRKRADEFAYLIAREAGKPLWEAHTEVEAVINKVDVSVTAYAERTGKKRRDSALQGASALRHKPHGVMAVLGPYNFPAHLPNGHIIPALIAGNTVLFKPSEKTPASGEMLVTCLSEAGLPENVVQLVIGGPEEGKDLVAHPGVDGVLFTGSAQTGIAINRKLAANPGKIVALEMGGNNPLVVVDTPKLDDAAVLIAQSAFTTAGQRCTAARRLIVKESVYDDLMSALLPLVRKLIVGEPLAEPQPFMGPVIDLPTAEGLNESFITLVTAGGKALLPMRQPMANKPFLTPGIIDTTAIPDRPDIELF